MPPQAQWLHLENDTESEDVDDELLVDWKGVKNGGSSFVQQKLPFKHVKRRDEPKKTTASLYPKSTGQTATSAHRILPPKQQVANLSAHVVSLSDSEPSEEVYLTNRELNHNPPQQLQGNVVCLDSDTESENVSSTHYLHRNSHEVEVEVEVEVEEEAEVSNVRKKRKITGRIPMSEEDKAQERREKLLSKEAEMLRKIEEKAEKKRQKEEEKKKLQEDNRRKREEEKLRKEAAKEATKERRRLEHEKNRWEKGKFALENTRALVDTSVVEKGLIGGHLLSKLAEKQLQFQLVSNPLRRSIIWRMKRPSVDSLEPTDIMDTQESKGADSELQGPSFQLNFEEYNAAYILFVFEAEEFAAMVSDNTLHTHISATQAQYPGFIICYLVNKLKWYLNKKDQMQFKSGETGWRRPPVEQALARLVTHYDGVHSRLCLDESEVAEHICGLMRSLAECPFKQKLTSLSVSNNGDHITKSDTFSEEIKSSLWLKALVALPRVPGSCALAIAKKYNSMRSLLNTYLDQAKTVHEKELLLQDLLRESVLGPEGRRRVGPACSRRIYRIFMAQNGNLKTDDVEQGADHFDDSD